MKVLARSNRQVLLVVTLFALMSGIGAAQTLTTLFTFTRKGGDFPEAALLQGTDGNLYGVASFGAVEGNGTIFRLTPDGTYTTLHRFQHQEGIHPSASLIEGSDGSLYGTAYAGGLSTECPYGCGAIFKYTPGGTLTRFYSFCSLPGCADGSTPYGPIVQGTDGNFYGTTFGGGASTFGTVFRVTPHGHLTTLHSFCSPSDCTDGRNPAGPLVESPSGDFYGVTESTIFRISTEGTLTTVANLAYVSGFFLSDDGNLYGTTALGGTYQVGTVFKLSPNLLATTLYSFSGPDGLYPSGLIPATDGNLYGATNLGGTTDNGTLFRVNPDGALTTVYNFCSQPLCSDGAVPLSPLVQHTNGTFYGPTFRGGYSYGTLFSFDLGFGPFVSTRPRFGTVGQGVSVLGTNLTGSSSVTFNGVPAAFTVVSSTLIKATVPVGATTGPVQVTTPAGTLESIQNFYVR